MKRLKKVSLTFIAVAAAGVLIGCAGYTPYAYHNDRDEMQGPGLFSGEAGVFTVMGKASKGGSESPEDNEPTDEP